MPKRLIDFPSRPRVTVGRKVYDEVTPARLDFLIMEIRAWVYTQDRTLTAEQRHSLFARLVAAAAVNALLDDDATPPAAPA